MKNVVILLVDALRFDCIQGYPAVGRDYLKLFQKYDTPVMTHIVNRGRVFSHAWTTHPYTSGACGSLATGRFPYRLNAAFNYVDSVLQPDIPTLGELLREQGVTTKHHFDFKPFSNLYGLDRGVDEVTYWDTERDGDLVRWVKNHDKPFYLLWHLGDVHSPYYQSWDDPDHNAFYQGYMSAVCDEMGIKGDRTNKSFWNRASYEVYPHWKKHNMNRLIQVYADGVQRFDQGRLSRIWRGLEQTGKLDDTLVILLADHGEEFVDGLATHGYSLHEDLLHIPLVLYNHKLRRRVIDRFVRIVDIPFTVAKLFGASTKGMDGVDLLDEIPEDLPGYAERTANFMCDYDPKKKFDVIEQAYRRGNKKVVRGSSPEYGSYIIQGVTQRRQKKEWSDLAAVLRDINQARVNNPLLKDASQAEINDIMRRMKELGYA